MKRKSMLIGPMLSLIYTGAHADIHEHATVEKFQGTYGETNCFYFTLAGVSQADPVVPGSAYFAISRTSPHSCRPLCIASGSKGEWLKIYVQTSGAIECGYAAVKYLIIEEMARSARMRTIAGYPMAHRSLLP